MFLSTLKIYCLREVFHIYIAIHIPSIYVLMLFLWLASAKNVIEHFKSKTSLVSVWTSVEKVYSQGGQTEHQKFNGNI